jgi:DNA-binding NarL/FixJ family response regulator
VLADDQSLVRTSFRIILDAQENGAVVAEARDGAERSRRGHRLARR